MFLAALVDENWALGSNGEQIVYIPDDLRHFKSLTEGKTVILGRKTLYTFPNKKPLKGRENLILSKNKSLDIRGARVFNDLESLLKYAPEDSFVIGGESVYKELLNNCQRAYITMVFHKFKADKYLLNLDKEPLWKLSRESDIMEFEGLRYCFRVYEKV